MGKLKKSVPLYEDIRALVLSALQTVARGVDSLQVHTNYEIGRRIVQNEQKGLDRAEYGRDLLNELSAKLSDEFGNGFSRSNLEYMRRFYLTYPGRALSISQTVSGKLITVPKSQTVSGKSARLPISKSVSRQSKSSVIVQKKSGQLLESERQPQLAFTLSWSHYVFLIGLKLEERSFYEIEATHEGWTLRELKRQFNAGLYERLALSRNKKSIRSLARKGQHVAKPQDLLKSPYVLEFLGLKQEASYSESELETAIVSNIETFLLELGKGFLFEARQKRYTFDEEHFFVDLVLYNRLLRCYVLIDLKIGKLTHQDLGQMQMYVNYFDRCIKTKAENHTVGIVLCKKKNSALVEITLPKKANIHAREYQLYLPSKDVLQQKLEEWVEEQGAP